MAWVYSYVTYQLLPLLFTSHRPLLATRCFLRVAYFQLFHSNHSAARAKEPVSQSSAVRPRPSAISQKINRSQKKFPGAGPQAYCICNTVCKTGGLAPGKVSQGEAPEGCASPGEANPSGVFSNGGNHSFGDVLIPYFSQQRATMAAIRSILPSMSETSLNWVRQRSRLWFSR